MPLRLPLGRVLLTLLGSAIQAVGIANIHACAPITEGGVLGLTLLMAVVTLLLGTMTVWFLRTATIGFPRFLIEIARKYGYREVEVQ